MRIWKRVLPIVLALTLVGTVFSPVSAVTVQGTTAQESWTINDLSVSGSSVTVTLTAPGDCLLVAALYTPEQAMISTELEDVQGKSGRQSITLPVDSKGRKDFTAKAFLLDPVSYAPLGEAVKGSYTDWSGRDEFQPLRAEDVSYDQTQKLYYANQTLLVFFAPGTSMEQIQMVTQDVGGEIIGMDDLLNLYQIKVTPSTLETLLDMADQLTARFDCVSHATCDTILSDPFSSVDPLVPNDPWNGDVSVYDWKDSSVGGSNWWIEAVEGQYAWSYYQDISSVPVGIIDSSIDTEHEDLVSRVAFPTQQLAERNDMTPWWEDKKPLPPSDKPITANQMNAHGTHVAGIIGANFANQRGISGLAWESDLLFAPVPSLDTLEILDSLSELVQSGAKVINISIGEQESTEGMIRQSAADFAAAMATLLAAKNETGENYDFIVVQSAGNGDESGLAQDAIHNLFACSITETTTTPSGTVPVQDVLDHIIIAGAAQGVDDGYQCTSFSNYGSQVDLCAPGWDIYSTLPSEEDDEALADGSYGTKNGTSQAAPIVSAVCALTWGVCPELPGATVRNIVCSATKEMVAPYPDTGSDLSYPMVNARLAVETALQYTGKTYPVTVQVHYEDGTPASGVAIDGTGLETAPKTSMDGTAVFALEAGPYRITSNPEGWYDQEVLTITGETTIDLTLKETFFTATEESGHLTINGWGPMPDYGTASSTRPPWSKNISSAEIHGVATIGENAFYQCKALAQVTMDDTVTGIEKYAFYRCSSLDGLELPEKLFYLNSHAFYECASLSKVDLPEYIREISDYAFQNCDSLTVFEIPCYVTSIGYQAFYNCDSLTGITIPASVTTMGKSAFYNCDALTTAIILGGLTTIDRNTFYDCDALGSVSLPNTLTTIGNSAFYSCDSLTGVTIPVGVTSIDLGAFGDCKSLHRISLPDGLLSLGGSAFSNCDALASVTLPQTLTTMGGSVFYDCDGLTRITIPGSVAALGASAFSSCEKLSVVTLERGVTTVGEKAFYLCSSLSSVYIPDTVTSVGDSAFYECKNLVYATIPEGLTELGSQAFYRCEKLTGVTIPGGVEIIGNGAFDECRSLTRADIQYGVREIEFQAFSQCEDLETISIPSSVTAIGDYAFQLCESVTRITVPNSVTAIGKYAFDRCEKLEHITLPSGLTRIEEGLLNGCSSLASISIPSSVTRIGEGAFYLCESLKTITIPSGVTELKKDTFRQCESLASIRIPASVTSISSSAFYGCSSLTDVYYGGSKDIESAFTDKVTIHYGSG